MEAPLRHSFRTRLAVQMMLVSGLLLAAFGTASWWYARQQLAHTIDLRIKESAHRLWKGLTPRSDTDEFRSAAQGIIGDDPASAVVILDHDVRATTLFASSDGMAANADFAAHLPPLGTPGLRSREAALRDPTSPRPRPLFAGETASLAMLHRPQMLALREPVFFTTAVADDEWRFGAFSNPHYTVFVGLSLRGFYAEVRGAALWFAAAGALGLGLAGLLAWWASYRAMRPLDRVIATAQTLTSTELDHRIPIGPRDDREFAQLISVLNGMMDRLQTSFEQTVRFTADASHELKTPLAVMQSTIHEALRQCPPDTPEHEQLVALAGEVARLKRITHSLLLLSQADAGKLPLQREDFDLSADLGRLVEDAEALCAQAGLCCEHSIVPGVRIHADRALMRQVFQNLLSNAVKYNRPDGKVTITLSQHAELTLTNTGPGISAEDQARLFERFHRGNAARDRRTDGSGLGLNIAFELAKANGAELRLIESSEDRTSFRVSMAHSSHQRSA